MFIVGVLIMLGGLGVGSVDFKAGWALWCVGMVLVFAGLTK